MFRLLFHPNKLTRFDQFYTLLPTIFVEFIAQKFLPNQSQNFTSEIRTGFISSVTQKLRRDF